jgi:hypothetical protein
LHGDEACDGAVDIRDEDRPRLGGTPGLKLLTVGGRDLRSGAEPEIDTPLRILHLNDATLELGQVGASEQPDDKRHA